MQILNQNRLLKLQKSTPFPASLPLLGLLPSQACCVQQMDTNYNLSQNEFEVGCRLQPWGEFKSLGTSYNIFLGLSQVTIGCTDGTALIQDPISRLDQLCLRDSSHNSPRHHCVKKMSASGISVVDSEFGISVMCVFANGHEMIVNYVI